MSFRASSRGRGGGYGGGYGGGFGGGRGGGGGFSSRGGAIGSLDVSTDRIALIIALQDAAAFSNHMVLQHLF